MDSVNLRVQLLRTTGDQPPANLEFGELAYSDANDALWIGKADSTSKNLLEGIGSGGGAPPPPPDLYDFPSIAGTAGQEMPVYNAWARFAAGGYKPLWRQCYFFGNLPNNTTLAKAWPLSGIDNKSIQFQGWATYEGGTTLPLPYVWITTSGQINFYYDQATRQLAIRTAADQSPYQAYFIATYTRTADAPVIF